MTEEEVEENVILVPAPSSERERKIWRRASTLYENIGCERLDLLGALFGYKVILKMAENLKTQEKRRTRGFSEDTERDLIANPTVSDGN